MIEKNSIKHHYFKRGYLHIKDISDVDYAHTKRVFKDFEKKNLGECYD